MTTPIDQQLKTMETAAALLAVATVTIGVAGDKLASIGDGVYVADLLPPISRIIDSLGETASNVTDVLLAYRAQSVPTPDTTPTPDYIPGPIPDMVIDGYVNYVIASKAIRIDAMPFHAWLAAGDRE